MKELGRYDTDLQMFVEKPREVNMNHLRFMRDLMEKGKFGRQPIGVPKGEFVFRLSDPEIRRYAMMQGDQELKPAQPQSQYEQQH